MASRAVLACLVALACAPASPPPRVAAPSVVDRTEVKRAIAVGAEIVAITSAGNLVRYDRDLRVLGEARVQPAVVAIASDGDRLYAALADGQIGAIDRALAFSPIARVAAEPRWLAVRRDVLVVVTIRAVERVGLDGEHRATLEIPPPDSPSRGWWSTFLLDSDELWLGADAGEWGGELKRLSLATGAATSIANVPRGVYGIVHAPGGAIWIHGGLIHMSSTQGYIAEIVGDAAKPLLSTFGSRRRAKSIEPAPLPVVAIVPRPRPLVIVWNTLYEASSDLKTWTKLVKIGAREHPGRPDAMSNYPGIVSVIDRGDAVIVATARDGLSIYRAP